MAVPVVAACYTASSLLCYCARRGVLHGLGTREVARRHFEFEPGWPSGPRGALTFATSVALWCVLFGPIYPLMEPVLRCAGRASFFYYCAPHLAHTATVLSLLGERASLLLPLPPPLPSRTHRSECKWLRADHREDRRPATGVAARLAPLSHQCRQARTTISDWGRFQASSLCSSESSACGPTREGRASLAVETAHRVLMPGADCHGRSFWLNPGCVPCALASRGRMCLV